MRQIEQHGLINGGDEARPTISAARKALDVVDTNSLAQRIVSGNSIRSKPARKPLDINEDLTKPT
jgi:hypothetical protein